MSARASLAATLGRLGRLAEALPLLDEVLETYMRMLGPDHVLTWSARAARAELLLQRGEVEHARNLQEQVLAAHKRLLGAEHAETLRSKTALAHTLLQMQQLDAARSLLDAVLRTHLRRRGPDHADTRDAREQLIDVQLQLGVLAGEAPPVPELHQNASMDDYGDALLRPSRRHGAPANSPWPRSVDDLLALDGHLSGSRNTPR